MIMLYEYQPSIVLYRHNEPNLIKVTVLLKSHSKLPGHVSVDPIRPIIPLSYKCNFISGDSEAANSNFQGFTLTKLGYEHAITIYLSFYM